jgi:hypothetical protein
MSKARQAPEGCQWRPSTLNQKVSVLERLSTSEWIGSVELARGKWINRDTGERFDTKDLAMASVERWA